MCMGRPKVPPTPAQPPPPPIETAQAPVVNARAQGEQNALAAKKGGRGKYRIDLSKSGPAGGSGLNVS